MTSKFFAAGNISSDSDESDDSVKINKNQRKAWNVAKGMDSGSDEDDKRKVLGEKEKKWIVIKKICQKIRDKLKINDYNEVLNMYQELLKEIEKAKKVIETDGYPNFYFKTMNTLIEVVNTFDGKKTLNVINSKSYTTLKQKLKKLDQKFLAQLEAFKTTKQVEEVEDIGQKEDQKEEEDSENNQSDSESQSQEDQSPLESSDPMVRRTYWMAKKQDNAQVKTLKKQIKKQEEEKEEEKEKDKQKEKAAEAAIRGKKFKLLEEKARSTKFTSDQAKRTLRSVFNQIGKTTTEQQRNQFLSDIKNIKKDLASESEKLSILVVETLFVVESSRAMNKLSFRKSDWTLIFNNLDQMYNTINKSKDPQVLSIVQSFSKDNEFYKPQMLLRTIVSFLNTLNDQLRKALVFTDVSEIEYLQRLQDLLNLIQLTYCILEMYEQRTDDSQSIRILASQLVQNTYYMGAATYTNLQNQYKQSGQPLPKFLKLANPSAFSRIAKLALKVPDGEKEQKVKLILYIVYNHAVFGREEGRNLILTTNIIDTIHNYSYYVQALFNRTLAQLGINAFTEGNLYEVQGALSDLCAHMRTKQLLAQGFLKQEQQVLQRKRMLPYHLHINIDLVESTELIASMLNEIPYTFTEGGRITSKTFKKIYEPYQRSHFIAEPLSSKDIIYSASKELQKANWNQCYNRLLELELWRHLANPQTAKQNILQRIKQQALKCYVLANQASFTTLKLSNLEQKFDLSTNQVRTILNKLIFVGDLNAAATLDGYIRFYHGEVNHMDKIIQELSEKASELVTTNERNLASRLGTHMQAQQDEASKRTQRRGVGSERNKLLGVKKVVVKQKKI